MLPKVLALVRKFLRTQCILPSFSLLTECQKCRNISTGAVRRFLISRRAALFSSTLHFLALISFAVHTVFGCCAHHSHADHAQCCAAEEHACDHEHSQQSCDDQSEHANCCDHHSHTVPNEIDSQVTYLCGGHQCLSEHDGERHSHVPHKCCELRCVYITASVVSTVDLFDNDALMVAMLPTDTHWHSSKLYFDQNSYHLGTSDIHPVSVRCALTQSWQI